MRMSLDILSTPMLQKADAFSPKLKYLQLLGLFVFFCLFNFLLRCKFYFYLAVGDKIDFILYFYLYN